jgi:hypothetical protein
MPAALNRPPSPEGEAVVTVNEERGTCTVEYRGFSATSPLSWGATVGLRGWGGEVILPSIPVGSDSVGPASHGKSECAAASE